MADGSAPIGVVGDPPADADEALSAAAASVASGDPASVLAADPSLVVAVGEPALLELARERPSVPIVPVGAGRGAGSIAPTSLAEAVPALVDGSVAATEHPLLDVAVDGESVARALLDVTLVPESVARISEYRVTSDGSRVGQFRADGVVLATPAGSTGYASRVDAPVLAAESGVVAVAPIAPFATDPDRWVLPLETVELAVVRDEVSVQVLADDRSMASVAAGDGVVVTSDGTVTLATPATGHESGH